MVAVAVEVWQIVQAVHRRLLLKLGHPPGHDPHAALEGGSLGGAEAPGEADDPGGVGHQVVLALGRGGGEQGAEVASEGLRPFAAADDLDEALREGPLLRGRQGRLVLDGVRDPAQEVGVAHHLAQRIRKLRDGEGEGPRDPLEDLLLVGEVAVSRPVRRGPRHPGALPAAGIPKRSRVFSSVGRPRRIRPSFNRKENRYPAASMRMPMRKQYMTALSG